MLASSAAVVMAALVLGCATTGGMRGPQPDVLSGLVLDPEGRPVSFAKISIVPEALADRSGLATDQALDPVLEDSRGLAVTTEGGRWVVDHLSSPDGTDLGLPFRHFYEVTVYKPGFHLWKESALYERGTLQLEVTLYPDAIEIEDVGNMVDTSLGEASTGTGTGPRQGE
ncbi:MAG: hypothetical protein CMP23_07365 [Rickettsiales bacterium]|nr:hypothetical protein [Rickettsiales bacterium]